MSKIIFLTIQTYIHPSIQPLIFITFIIKKIIAQAKIIKAIFITYLLQSCILVDFIVVL